MSCLKVKYWFSLALCALAVSCANHDKEVCTIDFEDAKSLTENSNLLQIRKKKEYYSLSISKPNTADKTYILGNKAPKENCKNFIKIPAKRVVIFSASHVYMMDTLGSISSIIAFSYANYSGNFRLHENINNKHIKTIGDFATCDIETILDLNPDLVIISGDQNENSKAEQIEKAGVPVIENIEWLEASALGRAEWIKLFGVVSDNYTEAERIYSSIKQNYQTVEAKGKELGTSNRYLIYGIPYQSSWMVPGRNSFMGNMLQKSGFKYPWGNNSNTGSIPIDLETIFKDENDASVWLGPTVTTQDDLDVIDSRLKNLAAWKRGDVYEFDNVRGANNLSLYWEQSVLRCDLLLQDLIQIAHDTTIFDKGLYFYRKIDD